MPNRLITISYTGLNAGGGVPKFNRDLHAAFPDRKCVHFCWTDFPFADRPDLISLPEWERARMLNAYLIRSKLITHDDVVVADGFWAWGLESFPYAVSHSHGIWGHVTWFDVQRGVEPENPFHHAAQIAFRGTWFKLKKRLTAVSDFIAENMEAMWGIRVDRVINNGVDTDLYRPVEKMLRRRNPLIIHGVNDKGNLNKGWDHIQAVIDGCPGADVMSLDEYSEWQGISKPEALANADLVVHPSGYEGNSMFIAEALACGVPIVAYDVGFLWTCRNYDMIIGRIMDRNWRTPDFTLMHVQDRLSKPQEREWQSRQARKVAVDNLSIDLFRKNWREYIGHVEDGLFNE